MDNYTDLYNELEALPSDSQDQLKEKYRKLAKKYHPDRNPNGADKMANITYAYSILSDPKKRELYDKFGSKYFKDTTKYSFRAPIIKMSSWIRSFSPFSSDANSSASSDNNTATLSNVKPKKKTNIQTYRLQVELEQLYNGAELPLCINCRCDVCQGKHSRNCELCNYTGSIKKEKLIKVKGLRDNDVIPLRSDGEDIDVILMQTTSFKYAVEGDDIMIISSQCATRMQAESGFVHTINYFNNETLTVNVAPGELKKDNKKIIPNYGLPKVNNPLERGNLIIEFTIL